MLSIAFDDLGLHRVIGGIELRNDGVRPCPGEAGDAPRGALRGERVHQSGEWQSEVVYAILDHEWRLRTS